jgi:outer membrane receptor protein involved in Fe transport
MRIAAKPVRHSTWSSAILGVSAATIALGLGHPARAQAGADAAASGGQLEEIVVTATKREEKLKDVPTAVSVLSASKLAEQHIVDVEDAIRNVPSVAFSTTGGEGQDNISIRGVSSNVGSQTVGIYLDDVPLLITNSYNGVTVPKFLDMARIEVLKGPQGTLFGAGSEGGTIRFISNLPKFNTYEGSVQFDISGTEYAGSPNYDFQGVVNVPIIADKLAARAAFEYGDQAGWINRITLEGAPAGNDINDERDLVFRLSARLAATDDLTVTASMFGQRAKQGDSPDISANLGFTTIQKQVTEFSRDSMFVPSVTVDDDLGFATLTSVSSYFWRQESRQRDGTAFNSAAIAQFFLDPAYPQYQPQNDSILANVASPVHFHDTWYTANQEFRLTSPTQAESGLPFKWTVGVFYSDQANNHRDYEDMPGFSSAFQSIYGYNINTDPALGDGDPNLFKNDVVYYVYDRNDLRQYAVFGQLDYDILPDLHAGVGGRYVYARESFTENGGGFFELGNVGVTSPYSQVARFYSFTPKFTLSYDITQDATAYASAAKGYRYGGATSPNDNIPCLQGFAVLGINGAPTTYGPDKLWTYELGAKSRLLNGALSVNAAAFYTDWSQIQESIIIPVCGGQFNSNVGDAESYGVEGEITYAPPEVPGFTFHVNGNIQHAQITSSSGESPAHVGDHILYVPDWQMSFAADYEFPVMDGYNAFTRIDYEYTGPSRGSFAPTDPNFNDPPYGVLNGSVGLRADTMEFSLYVKNLADDKTIIQRPVINSVSEGYTLRPFTLGITAKKSF